MNTDDDAGQQRATAVVAGSTCAGLGFGAALTLLLIGLKLSGIIGWSWWWIIAPSWIAGTLVLSTVAAASVIFVIVGVRDVRAKNLPDAGAGAGRPRPNQHGPAHRWRRP
jgi:hypothetical protein